VEEELFFDILVTLVRSTTAAEVRAKTEREEIVNESFIVNNAGKRR
jgi:hypothetical protein